MSRQTRPSLCGQRGAAVPDRIGLQPGHPNAFAFRIPDHPGQPPTPRWRPRSSLAGPPCDRGGSGGWSANSPTRLLPIGQLSAQTDQRLAGNRVIADRLVSFSDPDTARSASATAVRRPNLATSCRWQKTSAPGRRHHLAQATQTSL